MLGCEFKLLNLTLVPRSLNPRQSPAPNLQIDPAGQLIREGVTSDEDALAEIFDKIEQSVAEESLNWRGDQEATSSSSRFTGVI